MSSGPAITVVVMGYRNEATIVAELLAVQGKPVDIGGYYHPDAAKLAAAMRPSPTLNAVLARFA